MTCPPDLLVHLGVNIRGSNLSNTFPRGDNTPRNKDREETKTDNDELEDQMQLAHSVPLVVGNLLLFTDKDRILSVYFQNTQATEYS